MHKQDPPDHLPGNGTSTFELASGVNYSLRVPSQSTTSGLALLNCTDSTPLYLVQSPRHEVRVAPQRSPTPLLPLLLKTNLQRAATSVELKLLVSLLSIKGSAQQYLPGCSNISGLKGWLSLRANPAACPPTSPISPPRPVLLASSAAH